MKICVYAHRVAIGQGRREEIEENSVDVLIAAFVYFTASSFVTRCITLKLRC